MTLKEVYEKYNVGKTDQIHNMKPIMFIVPSKDYDLESWLSALNIDKFEKTYTYPKIEENPSILIKEEIESIKDQMEIDELKDRVEKLENIVDKLVHEKVMRLLNDMQNADNDMKKLIFGIFMQEYNDYYEYVKDKGYLDKVRKTMELRINRV